jgi:hypothetical protein
MLKGQGREPEETQDLMKLVKVRSRHHRTSGDHQKIMGKGGLE